MPLPLPPDYRPELISALTKVVMLSVAIVISLVTTLYWLLRSADTKQQEQLDDGADQFTVNKVDLEKIKQDITSIRAWVKTLEDELDDIEIKRVQDHESMLLIKDHHKRNHGEEIK